VIGAQSGLDRQAAARTVDRAVALFAGAGYVNGSPLSRAYRDVKAGSFMHPLGANRAYDYLARVALGEQASLQRAFPSHERGRLRGGADDARCGRTPSVSASEWLTLASARRSVRAASCGARRVDVVQTRRAPDRHSCLGESRRVAPCFPRLAGL